MTTPSGAAPERVPSSRPTERALRTLLLVVTAVACGASAAAFLWLLERATSLRLAHRGIVFGLPLLGLVLGRLLPRFGRGGAPSVERVIEELHRGGPGLPWQTTPVVLLGTVLTHAFGGSAGREGTAVQMGASMADTLAARASLVPAHRRQLVVAGIAGGFAAVFGTPLAGCVFALELGTVGHLDRRNAIPALCAALIGDHSARALGAHHTPFPRPDPMQLTPGLLGKWLLFAGAMAAASTMFVLLVRLVHRGLKRRLTSAASRMFCGGLALVALWRVVGDDSYLGLGIPTLLRAFHDPLLPASAFPLKLVFTAVTVGSGFLGGEVTPLFFMGGALGNTLGRVLDIPVVWGAGIGMVAMFAAASNTPLASTLMAAELLGLQVLPHAFVVCSFAYLLGGPWGLYTAQRGIDGKPVPRLLARYDEWRRERAARPPPLDGALASTSRGSRRPRCP